MARAVRPLTARGLADLIASVVLPAWMWSIVVGSAKTEVARQAVRAAAARLKRSVFMASPPWIGWQLFGLPWVGVDYTPSITRRRRIGQRGGKKGPGG